jgi:hypothetical protein
MSKPIFYNGSAKVRGDNYTIKSKRRKFVKKALRKPVFIHNMEIAFY